MKKAIVTVSFGTTYAQAEQTCIRPVEQALAAAYPDWQVRRAYTARIVLRRLREQAAEERPGKPGQRPHAPGALKRLCRPTPQAQRTGKAERQPDRRGRSLQCGGRQRAGLPREHRRAERKQHHSRPDPSHDHRVPLPDIFCSTIWKAFPNFA